MEGQSFLRQMFSEQNGRGSSNRVCLVSIISILLACIVRIVIATGKFPEIPGTLADLIKWIIAAMLFGNVAKNGIAAWQNVKCECPDPVCGEDPAKAKEVA